MLSAFNTFGKLGALASSVARAWPPLALWPDGVDSAGMWISPSTLPASFNDYTGTTPVATPGTVANSANPVGLALDIRAGAPDTLGPELVVNGDFSDGTTGWTITSAFSVSGGKLVGDGSAGNRAHQDTVTTAGKWHQVSFDYVSMIGAQLRIGNTSDVALVSFSVASGTSGTHSAKFLATGTTLHLEAQLAEFTGSIDNISVREVPGNHMLQSTSVDRPLLSARVNLLTYTEDFGNAVWWVYEVTKTPNSGTAPDGTTTACLVKESTATSQHVLGGPSFGAITAGTPCNIKWYVKNAGVDYVLITFDGPGGYASATFDLVNGVFVRENHLGDNMYVPGSATVESIAGGYLRIAASFTPLVTGSWSTSIKLNRPNISNQDPTYEGDGTSGLYIWHPQTELGTTATPYQPILTDGSTYTATGITPWQLYDGTDDGMATAAFSAGTLTSGMDCLIAVRRDSDAATYLVSDTGSRGFFEWESGDTNRPDVSAGTPTYYVDGVACTATRGALFTALTAGDWHILEARGLDLSTWGALEVSSLTSYRLNGAVGDIMLFPNTASTEDKDAARQYLADLYGVTLP